MALTDWPLLEIRSPLFFSAKKNPKSEVPKQKQGGVRGANKTKRRDLTEKGQMYTQSMTINQRRRFHFFFRPITISESKDFNFFHNPANMSQGKRTHQSFLQWGTKRGRFRPNRNRTIIFFSTFFLFKHIPFLNRFFSIHFSRSP